MAWTRCGPDSPDIMMCRRIRAARQARSADSQQRVRTHSTLGLEAEMIDVVESAGIISSAASTLESARVQVRNLNGSREKAL